MSRLLTLLTCVAVATSADGLDLEHTKWTAVLIQYVNAQSRVNYAGLKADATGDLDRYLDEISNPWPRDMDADATKAALINAYNALTVRWIISNYPVASIWRTHGPFRMARHKVDGKLESLDSIETRLRNMGDPRIHGALVCAARSCPSLRREAYTKRALSDQLDDNFRAWLAKPSWNQFLPDKHLAKVSKIFEWYAADFQKVGGVPAVLERFAPPNSFAVSNRLDYLKYNWGLNDSGSMGASYSGLDFYIDYVRNGYLRSDVEGWFFGLGKRYGVNTLILGSIYVGAIPFFPLSIAWLVRNVRRGRAAAALLLSAAFLFVSAYLYLLAAGQNIPIWVYILLAGMLAFGIWSTLRKVRSQMGRRTA